MKKNLARFLFSLLLLPFMALAQSQVTGIVLDQTTGLPMPGVNIKKQGTDKGTSSDFDGQFKVQNAKQGDRIVFTYVGFKTETITVTELKKITVSLSPDANILGEVKIQVGYGNVKKKDLTGSTTTLSSKEFNKGVNISAENLLNGRVAGVSVNTSGAPGSSSEIRIRGGSSLFASNNPLIVMDGLPLDSATNTGSSSFLASLNPATIESITVLKDASATAIYGSRAANGVIIITTKKGGKKLTAEYNVQYSAGKLIKTVSVLNANQFREVALSRLGTAVITDPTTGLPTNVNQVQIGTANTDWQRAIYRQTGTVDQSLALRGSIAGVLPVSLTLGNLDQQGLRLTNGLKRNTVGLVITPSLLKDHLKLRLAANYGNENNRFSDGIEEAAIAFNPTVPIYDTNSVYGGYFQYLNSTAGSNKDGLNSINKNIIESTAARNPVAQLLQTNDSGRNNRLFGNFEIDYKLHFFPAIRAVVNLGFDESRGMRRRLSGADAASSFIANEVVIGNDEFTTENRKNKLIDAYLVYNKDIKSLKLELTAGHSYQKFEGERFESGNIFDPGRTLNNETTTFTPRVLLGYFGRTNLNFRDKYLLTLSMRRDATSAFEKESRWGNFPSAAFAWKISDDLFKENETVSNLKLRLGWGITGQQDIPDPNGYLPKYTLSSNNTQYSLDGNYIPVAQADKLTSKLKWEETTTYNAGLDFGFFKNRLTGEVDVFYKESADLLQEAPTADGSNFSNRVVQNVGVFSTKGIELALNYSVIQTEKFDWTLNFNATKFERRIDKLSEGGRVLIGNNISGTGVNGQVLEEGFTPYSFFVYKQLYNANGKVIDGAFADLNQDGVINQSDRYIYNNPDPDFTAGLASNMTYKNFDFSFNLRASVGNRVFNAVDATYGMYNKMINGSIILNSSTSVLETNYVAASNEKTLSDVYIENASFLKLDNINIGYTVKNILNNRGSFRFSAGMQNLFTITKYKGLDPEVTGNGVDKTIYPRQRSLIFGANFKF